MQTISGIVVEGKKKGRELGFPTANIVLEEMLEGGIFAGKAKISGEEYLGAIFIWPNNKLLEIHILDFNGDLYGKIIEVEMAEKIRDAQKFANEEDLKKQIAEDVKKIRALSTRY